MDDLLPVPQYRNTASAKKGIATTNKSIDQNHLKNTEIERNNLHSMPSPGAKMTFSTIPIIHKMEPTYKVHLFEVDLRSIRIEI